MAFGSADKTIGVWMVSSEERIKTLIGHRTESIWRLDLLTIEVWRILNGECLKTLYAHSSSVNSVVFSPNGEYLASGSRDKTIGVWKFFD